METSSAITTISAVGRRQLEGERRKQALTLLLHPDIRRVGEVARLDRVAHLTRTEPCFTASGTDRAAPLGDPGVSRKAIVLSQSGSDTYELRVHGARSPLFANRVLIRNGVSFHADDLERGVVLELGGRIVLLWHLLGAQVAAHPQAGLVGENEAVEAVRGEIARVADLDVPVLIRGESGVGKELVARAIHNASRRRERECVCINMAAVAPETAASELFGHVRGAFTGAASNHNGVFVQADGGTLFLDEIGDTPYNVQAMLLRTVEDSEVRAVGSRRTQRVDVRLITATDMNLEQAIAEGSFRAPLKHRLAGYELYIPPLRERRDDVSRLFVHFLRQELARVGELHRLEPVDCTAPPWIPSELMAALASFDWPGNVRQLRNAVCTLVISNRGARELRIPPALSHLLAASEPEREPAPSVPRVDAKAHRPPSEITDEELLEALRANDWKAPRAADALGISRTTIYKRIEKCPHIRKASDVSKDELMSQYEACAGDVELMSQRLRVSKRALQLRMRSLKIGD